MSPVRNARPHDPAAATGGTMLDRLLPSPSAMSYAGSRLALWLAGFLVVVKVAIALGAIFNGHYAASVADGIPLESYTAEGAQAVLALFGNLGFSQCLLGVVGLLVIARYRALLPGYLLLLVVEHVGRKALALFLPIPRVGGSGGGMVNWVILALLVVALALSLRNRAPASSRA
jgi:hypothetical protein